MDFRENVALAPMTTFRIGGPARWFVEAATSTEVSAAVEFARQRQLALFVLGGGSNVLIADRGFNGLVLRIVSTGMTEFSCEAGQRTFSVAAGESWDDFVDYAVARNCGGIECLAGIPGTTGGAPIQNIGAYGQEAADTIASVQIFDLQSNLVIDLDAAACRFRYRGSIFNHEDTGRYVVLRVSFRLREQATACIIYKDLQLYFKNRLGQPSLAEVAAAVREIRSRKGMLLADGDRDTCSAGSFFKNPIVPTERLAELAAAALLPVEDVPRFASGLDGKVKVPAAWLVEQAGFNKGYRKGKAAVSSRHSLALTNQGGANAADILALSDEIRLGVQNRFSIRLELEPVLVGC